RVAQIIASLSGRNYENDQDAIRFLLSAGFSNGKTSPTIDGFAGSDYLTRAEAVTFLKNVHTMGMRTLQSKPNERSIVSDNELNGNLPDDMYLIRFSDNFKVTIVGNLSTLKDQNIKFTIQGFNQSNKGLFFIEQYISTDKNGNFIFESSEVNN